jgi:ligand-binding sensor domain-containing protein
VNTRLATSDSSDSLQLPLLPRPCRRTGVKPCRAAARFVSLILHATSEFVAQFRRPVILSAAKNPGVCLARREVRTRFFAALRMTDLPVVVGFLTLCALMAPTSARAERLPLRVYSTADGLPSNQINCVKRDSHGFLWFCTAEGLSRFDGYTFTNYGIDEGLPDRVVTDFLETRSGEYWVATSRGLARFDPKPWPKAATLTSYWPYTGLRAPAVNTLLEDHQGAVWVGTNDGLFRLRETHGGWSLDRQEFKPPTDEPAEHILEDHAGRLWIAVYTSQGAKLYRRALDGQVDVFQPAFFHDNRIQSMLEDRRNGIWVGTYHGLALFLSDPKSGGPRIERVYTKRDGLGGDEVPGLFQSSDGRLWVGAGGVGTGGTFEVLSDATDRHVSFKRLMDPTSISAEDREGNLWLGGTRLARNGFVSYGHSDGLGNESDARQSVFEGSDGELYVVTGVHNRLIRRFDDQRFMSVAPKVPGHDASWDWGGWGWGQIHFQDHTGEWWIATANGLLRYPKVERLEDLAHTSPKATYTTKDGLGGDDIFRLYEDSRGNVWIGAWGGPGLTRWERSTGRFHTFGASEGTLGREPTAFREDRAGNLWVGQWGGTLARFRRGQFTLFTKSDGFPEGTVSSIFSDHAGRLWAGTSRGGLVRIDEPSAEQPRFVVYTTNEGLSSDNVGAITEDHYGRIYFWTGRGVDRLRPDTAAIRHYTEVDGLVRSGADVNVAFCDRHGRLWFAMNGLSRLDPAPDRPDAPPPPIRITKVRVRGTEYPMSELGETNLSGLLLQPGEDEIQIEFASLNFAVGDVIKYQYRLDGTRGDWSTASENRTVNYPRLSPGRYRFLVRAINADGLVSSVPASLSFRLLPPLWRRRWFLALAALLGAALIYWAYRFRLDRMLELERVRTRIATDLHDDVGSSITQIAIMSEVARRQGAEVAEPLAQIAGLSRELVDSMGDIVWAINPKRDHLGDLAQRMRRFASDVLSTNGVGLEFHAPVERADASLQADLRREVFLVFKESINNIARHSQCKRVEVLLSLERQQLVMRVCDDGRGFLMQSGDGQGHGLASMRDRAHRLGGGLRTDSEPDKGTTITLTVPLA